VRTLTERRKGAITAGLVSMIAMDMRPINLIEGKGFKRFMKIVEPGYTVPKREYVSSELTEKHKVIKNQVRSEIDECAAVSFTTDIWSSIKMEGYMTVTAHMISSDWEMKNYVLETKIMEESHTGVNIATRLGEVADAYGIPAEKRVAVVSDNASNMVVCLDTLKAEESWENVKGVRCAGHTLQLCINAALKNHDPVTRTVGFGRRLVSAFKKSCTKTAALTEKQRSQNVVEHCLIQDVATRWNSTYSMLERLCEQRWPISAVLSDPNITRRADRSLDLTTEQWAIAEDTATILQPFVTLTEMLSKEENVSTISAVLPLLSKIKNEFLTVGAIDSTATKALKRKLTEEIDRRWEFSDPTDAAVLGAALDPRYKRLKWLSDEEKQAVRMELTTLAERLRVRPAVRVREEAVSDADSQASGSDTASPAKMAKISDRERTRKLLSMDDDDDDDGSEGDQDEGPTAERELNDFVRDKSKASSGPLSWWKDNAPRYPKLAAVAKMILSIPATSTPSERIFSKAGFIVNKNRSCLLPKNVDTLVFLAHNEIRVQTNSSE